MELGQCLRLLKSSSSDNEKMAALMLVAKLVKSEEIGAEGRKKVFHSVGFTFINRLLATDKVPDGCRENPYHKLAVTILACFCTDEELVVHPQVTAKIPHFNKFIQTKGTTLAEDSLHCLRAMSCSPGGVQYLIKHHSLEALTRAYIMQNEVSDSAKDILLAVMGSFYEKESSSYFSAVVLDIVCILANEFRANQDELKFKICDMLYSILARSCSSLDSSEWLEDVSVGLRDILSSRIDSQRKGSALCLSAILCQMFGLDWVVQTEVKFLLLLLHLASVEVRLIVEGKELEEITENSSLLCSCFILLENAIVFISKHSDQDDGPVSPEVLLQIHTVLIEAFTFILYLLKTTSEGDKDSKELISDYPIIIASVRVLGAWLAEDSLSLSSEVYHLLPFLMQLCSISSPRQEDQDLLKFLLPGLCHMTADDKGRGVLMEIRFQKIVASYMEQLLPLCNSSSEIRGRLCLCCGVLMNVCVSAPDEVRKDSSGSYDDITSLLLKIFTNNDSIEDDILLMNAIVLFLMVTRRKVQVVEDLQVWCFLLKTLVRCLKYSPYHVSSLSIESRTSKWNEISELWFISIQELNSLAPSYNGYIKEAASKCSAVQMLLEMLAHQNPKQGDEIMQTSVYSLLQTLQ